jgi:hypothetical protein
MDPAEESGKGNVVIALDKAYRREPIPGIMSVVASRVRSRSYAMLNLKMPPFPVDGRDDILSAFDQWEPDRVYDASPFKEVLKDYPGPSDMTALYDYQKRLDVHMSDDKQMNEWANNIITIISKELWPDPKKFWRE